MDLKSLTPLTLTYDDPFNLVDARSYRASMGFYFKDENKELFEKFKKLGYHWTYLPPCKALTGEFPYRNKSSLAFGSTRFLPGCMTYLMRNKRAMKVILNDMGKRAGTLEMIDSGLIKYFMALEKRQEFFLTQKEAPAVKNEDKYTNIYYKKNQ